MAASCCSTYVLVLAGRTGEDRRGPEEGGGAADYGLVLFAAVLLASWWLARRDGDLGRVAAALWAPVMPHALVLVPPSADYSFPSDHAVMAGAGASYVVAAPLLTRSVTLLARTPALPLLTSGTHRAG